MLLMLVTVDGGSEGQSKWQVFRIKAAAPLKKNKTETETWHYKMCKSFVTVLRTSSTNLRMPPLCMSRMGKHIVSPQSQLPVWV